MPVRGSSWHWHQLQLPNWGVGWPPVPAGVDGGNQLLQASVAAAVNLNAGYLETFLFCYVVGQP